LVIAELTTFYTRQLDELVGSDFTAPLLASFAEYWLHRTGKLIYLSRLISTDDRFAEESIHRLLFPLRSPRPAGREDTFPV
jgi:hypothetical protein